MIAIKPWRLCKIIIVIGSLVFPQCGHAQTAAEARNPSYWNQHYKRMDEIHSPNFWHQQDYINPIPGVAVTHNSSLLERVNHCQKLSYDLSAVAENAAHTVNNASNWYGGHVPNYVAREIEREILVTANSSIRDIRYARADGADVETCLDNARQAIGEIKRLVRDTLGRTY
jgi:hypothetical protein